MNYSDWLARMWRIIWTTRENNILNDNGSTRSNVIKHWTTMDLRVATPLNFERP